MASLKETKNRIVSVQSTLKITSAMKMVASAKFHQAQQAVKKVDAYEATIQRLLAELFEGRAEVECALAIDRPIKRVALVPLSSDTGLCGSYNSNVIKEVEQIAADYKSRGIEVVYFPVGEKITHTLSKNKIDYQPVSQGFLSKPSMSECRNLATTLIASFLSGEIDQVRVVYHRFKTATRQLLTNDQLLPIKRPVYNGVVEPQDLLTEPSPADFLERLVPQVVTAQLYMAVSESLTSEHAARMTAMQIATDNANDLLKELTKLYNKTRQQAITSEILDLVGGRAHHH